MVCETSVNHSTDNVHSKQCTNKMHDGCTLYMYMYKNIVVQVEEATAQLTVHKKYLGVRKYVLRITCLNQSLKQGKAKQLHLKMTLLFPKSCPRQEDLTCMSSYGTSLRERSTTQGVHRACTLHYDNT